MSISADITNNINFSELADCIQNKRSFVYTLKSPSLENKEKLKSVVIEYLKVINLEKSYNLLCLCLEEIMSNSIKANIKRAFFMSNNLDINNPEDYKKGMEYFKENGLSKIKDGTFVEKINKMGLYVKLYFNLDNNCFTITAKNNSVMSKEEIERVNKKLKLSENKSPEELFMNSIDQTEGAGLGIIMIKKILSQLSSAEDCFSIRATDTETITELKIQV